MQVHLDSCASIESEIKKKLSFFFDLKQLLPLQKKNNKFLL